MGMGASWAAVCPRKDRREGRDVGVQSSDGIGPREMEMEVGRQMEVGLKEIKSPMTEA